MAFSKGMLEYLHDSGQMPDWAYYQQNGKSASENLQDALLREQRQRFIRRRQEQELAEYKRSREKEIDEELEKQLEEKLGDTLDKVLYDLLKDFQ